MPVTDEMRAKDTPPDVEILAQAPPPFDDPTLGVAVQLPPIQGTPVNRLVAIGDARSFAPTSRIRR
jgi:hypothetical protein